MTCLERAHDNGDPWIIWTGVAPRLDKLRSTTRFKEMLQNIALAELELSRS